MIPYVIITPLTFLYSVVIHFMNLLPNPKLPKTNIYLNQWWVAYWRIYASLDHNELIMFGTARCFYDNVVKLICFVHSENHTWKLSITGHFVRAFHRWPEGFPHKGSVKLEALPYYDVIMLFVGYRDRRPLSTPDAMFRPALPGQHMP